MELIGFIILGVGFIMNLLGGIMILIKAFQESVFLSGIFNQAAASGY